MTQRPPRSAPSSRPRPHVLAVDLGTGGPKVAVLASTGRVVAHAFRAVGIDLTDDGGAEQSPQAWWDAIVASAREALADAGVAPEDIVGVGCTSQWSGTVPVDDDGVAIGPAITWMDSRGARAVRETVRGALNVQGYSASKLAKWVRRTGGIPSLSGKDPVGHIHFLRQQRPEVYAAAAVFLEPVDYLGPAPHRPGPRLARLHHVALGDGQPRHQRRRLRRLADGAGGPRAGQAARPRPDGQRARRAGPGRRRRARPAAGHAGRGRHRGPALGGGRLGCGGRLRRPPLHRHLELDQLPRPVQEDRCADQHRLLPLGHPGPLPRGRRARDRRRLPDLAARQRAVPRRRPGPGRASHAAPPTSSASSTTWPRPSPSDPTASCSRPGSTASARRSTTTPSGAASTTCRCRPPGPTWCGRCSRASR